MTTLMPKKTPRAFIVLILPSVLPILTVFASRAYPHGCLYRHPSYYTYDERDDISWAVNVPDDEVAAAEFENHDIVSASASIGHNHNHFLGEQLVDFRKLPPKSSKLRRPYDRYRLTRRLGAGKFSDVFEAVDVQWEEKCNDAILRNRKRRIREGGYCGETTEDGEETEAENNFVNDNTKNGEGKEDSIDPESLVVLKCLKPVTERKIRRELLVLTHCATLPNLARVIGIVLPDSMDEDDDNVEDTICEEELIDVEERQTVQPEITTQQQNHHNHSHRKRRRHAHSANHLQRDNIGSITDAAAEMVRQRKPPPSSTSTPPAASSTTVNSNSKSNQHHAAQQLPALVLEHAGQQSQWFCHGQQQNQQHVHNNYLTEYEMKYYLCHLLVALDGLHAAGIMHRDVKPRNTLINRFISRDNHDSHEDSSFNLLQHHHQQLPPPPLSPPPLVLVDLGLADFYLPGKSYNVRVASRHYKSPELLIGFQHYDYAIDMWSVGCILAGLLFRREPFFRGRDNEDQLGKIVSVLGTRDFLPYCRKCNVRLSGKARAAIGKYCSRASSSSHSSSSSSEDTPSLLDNDISRRRPWMSFLSPTTPVPSPDALDLLDRLLVYDHEQRWTAREALGHAFFDEVRERVLGEVRERMVHEEERRRWLQQQSMSHFEDALYRR